MANNPHEFTWRLPPSLSFYGKLPHGKVPQSALQKTVNQQITTHQERNIWVVTKAYGDNYYDIQRSSSMVFEFDFQTGKLAAAGTYTNNNPNRHLRVWNCLLVKLEIGDQCRIGYRDNNVTQKPQIKTLVRQASGQVTSVVNPAIVLALWSQGEGTCFLSNSVASPVIQTHGFNTFWTGSSNIDAAPLGLVVSVGSTVATAQATRDVTNTFWETLSLITIPIATLVPDVLTCPMASSPSVFPRLDGIWTNSDLSLLLAAEFDGKQLFRKRGPVWQQITFTGMGALTLTGINMSPLGVVLFPETTPIWPMDSVDSSGLVTFASQANSGNEKIKAWAINTAATNIAMAWQLDPQTALPSGAIVNANGENRIPCSPTGTQFAMWVSGRKRLPHSTAENKSLLRNYDNSPAIAHGLDTGYSRELVAAICGITNGSISWKHSITHTATAAIEDTGLLNPLTSWLTANIPLFGDNSTSCAGRYAQDAVRCEVGLSGAGFNDIYLGPYGDSGQGFQIPQYDYFHNVSIVGLPLTASNTAQPRIVEGELNNMAVFTEYAAAADVGGEGVQQNCRVVGDGAGNYYFAYLVPVPILVSGRAMYTLDGAGSNLSLGLASLSTLTVLERLGGGAFQGNHVPNVEYAWRRFLRKIGPTGALLAEAEMSQTYTASWYEDENTLGASIVTPAAIGGSSTNPIYLGDNIWQIMPVGDVVFALVDYHDLGPNYYPSTKLVVMDSSSLDVLHTIELRLDNSTLPSDITDGGGNIVFRAGEHLYAADGQNCRIKGGVTPEGQEWAAVWISQDKRDGEIPTQQTSRLMIVTLAATPSDPPTVVQDTTDTNAESGAIVAGNLLDLNYSSNWKIRQMV